MKTFLPTVVRCLCAATLCHALSACAGPDLASAFPLESDFAKANATGAVVTDTLDLGAGLRLPVRIETTRQGNGTLTVGNLSLRLMDKHDDGLVYAGHGVLRLDIVRLARGPGPAALIVSGIAMHTGEKESDPAVPESIVYVYQVDCAAGKLVRSWRNTDIDIELDTQAGGIIHCAR